MRIMDVLVVALRHSLLLVVKSKGFQKGVIWILKAIARSHKPYSWVIELCLKAEALVEVFLVIIVSKDENLWLVILDPHQQGLLIWQVPHTSQAVRLVRCLHEVDLGVSIVHETLNIVLILAILIRLQDGVDVNRKAPKVLGIPEEVRANVV
jgi:hypothetical protein